MYVDYLMKQKQHHLFILLLGIYIYDENKLPKIDLKALDIYSLQNSKRNNKKCMRG